MEKLGKRVNLTFFECFLMVGTLTHAVFHLICMAIFEILFFNFTDEENYFYKIIRDIS